MFALPTHRCPRTRTGPGSTLRLLRVLFVSHTSDFSGAETALLRLLTGLSGTVQCAVACPPLGRLGQALDALGVERLDIPGTGISFRLHPVTTTRGLIELGRSVVAVRRLARSWGADVIHANGVRAGLLAVPVARLGGPAVVVQVHDHLPRGALGRAVREVLARADGVLAVSRSTAENFDAGLRRSIAETVYVSIDSRRFAGPRDDGSVRAALGVPADAPLLGEVAQITPWKGQLEAIETLALIRRELPDAHLLIVGHVAFAGSGVRYDNHAYLARLHARASDLGVTGAVHFLGHRDDVPALLSALDVLLLPSWDEPFGTAALEALAAATVPLVSANGGAAEYVEEGVTGRVLPPRDPAAWATAALALLRDPTRRRVMGERGRAVAVTFTDEAYAAGCLAAYSRALTAHAAGRRVLSRRQE
jgi:glycosyltransferase involved in cell wall biosynthesis